MPVLPQLLLGIGAPRSGTTWLYHNLARHPHLWTPPFKELHFFDHDVPGRLQREQAVRRYHLSELVAANARGVMPAGTPLHWFRLFALGDGCSNEWYTSLLAAAPAGRIPVDITPDYGALGTTAIDRARQMCRKLSVVYLLRDPIDRTWSQAALARAMGFTVPAAEASVDEIRVWALSPSVAQKNAYASHLARWRQRVGHERVLVRFHEQVRSAPDELLAEVSALCGVPHNARWFTRSASVTVNKRAHSAVPERWVEALAPLLVDGLRELAGVLSGPPGAWLARCEQAL